MSRPTRRTRAPVRLGPVYGSMKGIAMPPAVSPDFTVFYYTYSTIAQTLAGLLGFMVAIVLFRMQAMQSKIDAYWNDMVRPEPDEAKASGKSMRYIFECHNMGKVKERLTPAVISTLVTISMCIVMIYLSNFHIMDPDSRAAWTCCGLAVALSLITVSLYVPIVREITIFPIRVHLRGINQETGQVLEGKALQRYLAERRRQEQSNPPTA